MNSVEHAQLMVHEQNQQSDGVKNIHLWLCRTVMRSEPPNPRFWTLNTYGSAESLL